MKGKRKRSKWLWAPKREPKKKQKTILTEEERKSSLTKRDRPPGMNKGKAVDAALGPGIRLGEHKKKLELKWGGG